MKKRSRQDRKNSRDGSLQGVIRAKETIVKNQGPMQVGVVHSTSKGRSHGNHTGIGLREKQGAGTSIALHVPGMQMDALPSDTHGRILNSVLTMVGHTGTSNGKDTGPTVSGGTGMSGRQGRALPAPKQTVGPSAMALTSATITANRETTITYPNTAERPYERRYKRGIMEWMLPSRYLLCQERSPHRRYPKLCRARTRRVSQNPGGIESRSTIRGGSMRRALTPTLSQREREPIRWGE